MQDVASETLEGIDPHSRDGRSALARMVMKLFDLWRLSSQDQMGLLGLSEFSRTTLSRYRRGEPLADNRDLIDRVGNILAIHRSLRILFPKNRELAYLWPTTPNMEFEGLSPVAFTKKEGFLGLLMVRRYLDFQRGE